MISELPRSTRTEPLFPYTTRFRSVREWQPASKPSDQPAYRALDQTAASDPADDGGAISCRCDRASPSAAGDGSGARSEEHTSELQSLMLISYAVFGLKKKTYTQHYLLQST